MWLFSFLHNIHLRSCPFFTVYSCLDVELFPGGAVVKNVPASAGDARDLGSVPGLRRSSGEGNPLQYSCLGYLLDRGAWWAVVSAVVESWKWLSDSTINHISMGLFVGSLFCSFDQCVCFCASTVWFWWLWLCNIVWNQGA